MFENDVALIGKVDDEVPFRQGVVPVGTPWPVACVASQPA